MKTTSNMYERLCHENLLYEAWRVVKNKNSSGGIDGVSIAEFEEDIHHRIRSITDELKAGTWIPQPYKSVQIPKKNNEKRMLGLLSVKDKVVQTAIKLLIEPKLERIFVGNSYGYRPGKGHNKAIKRALYECQNKKKKWVLRLDIDNYFDSIRHDLLSCRLLQTIGDDEIVRLIMLCVKMGQVDSRNKWQDVMSGVPQGAVLSPILSNFYLHTFDKAVLGLSPSYVRYADDFFVLCETRAEIDNVLENISQYLDRHLSLRLNVPEIADLDTGFDFLGINITKKGVGLSDVKMKDLKERMERFCIRKDGFTPESIRSWNGICAYYGYILPQEYLVKIDRALNDRLKTLVINGHKMIANQSMVKRLAGQLEFLSEEFRTKAPEIVKELIGLYRERKGQINGAMITKQNEILIAKRKREYHKREGDSRELVVNTFGCFVGLTQKGVTVKQSGKIIYQKPLGALSHITIIGKGITMSTNLIEHCLANKISIDFFGSAGAHIGSILSTKYIEGTFWNEQANCGDKKRFNIAQIIIAAKLKNQFNLVKYFHKYHKHNEQKLHTQYGLISDFNKSFNNYIKDLDLKDSSCVTSLVAHEAQGAMKYWGYIRELLADDKVGFEKRERKGARDIVNCMLNYGYAILYSRVWKALLRAKLNPFDSIIHVRQAGKPTFVYDVVEIFRSQVVDRVVVSIVQKKGNLAVENGKLSDDTKKQLSKNILERLNRYENYRGEEVTMDHIINLQAKEIASYITNEKRNYKPYIAKW